MQVTVVQGHSTSTVESSIFDNFGEWLHVQFTVMPSETEGHSAVSLTVNGATMGTAPVSIFSYHLFRLLKPAVQSG